MGKPWSEAAKASARAKRRARREAEAARQSRMRVQAQLAARGPRSEADAAAWVAMCQEQMETARARGAWLLEIFQEFEAWCAGEDRDNFALQIWIEPLDEGAPLMDHVKVATELMDPPWTFGRGPDRPPSKYRLTKVPNSDPSEFDW